MKYLNKNIVSFLFSSIFLVQSCFAVAQESNNESNWRFSLVSDFAKTKDPMRFGEKTTTLKTGSIGLQGNYDLGGVGEVFVRYGMGYSPSETFSTYDRAIVAGEINGSVTAKNYEYGYMYPYDIVNSPFSLDFKISKTVNQHTGNGLTGSRSGKDIIANFNSELNFTRGSVGLNYQLDEDSVLTAGIGRYDWSVSGELIAWEVDNGDVDLDDPNEVTLNNGDPDASYVNGADGFYFLEIKFPFADRVVNIGVRRSQFNNSNESTILNEIYGGISIQF